FRATSKHQKPLTDAVLGGFPANPARFAGGGSLLTAPGFEAGSSAVAASASAGGVIAASSAFGWGAGIGSSGALVGGFRLRQSVNLADAYFFTSRMYSSSCRYAI